MTNLLFFISLYLFGATCDWLYRFVRSELGKPTPLRPLYKWEKQGRRFLVLVMLAIVFGQELLVAQGLALRPNVSTLSKWILFAALVLWLSLVCYRRMREKAWSWSSYFDQLVVGLPVILVAAFVTALSGNNFEYDIITENGKTYLHTSEQEGWSDHYVHKYEVVNDYLMKAKATDYDIHRLSEHHYNLSYEEKHFSNEDTND